MCLEGYQVFILNMEITDDKKGVGSEGRKWKGVPINVKKKKRDNRCGEESCKKMRKKSSSNTFLKAEKNKNKVFPKENHSDKCIKVTVMIRCGDTENEFEIQTHQRIQGHADQRRLHWHSGKLLCG